MNSIIRPAVAIFAALTVVCGIVYPSIVTGIGRLAFPEQAAGSLVEHKGQLVGSALIGQAFSSPKYFWGRPSATTPMPNNAASSSGSNLGQTNPAQLDAVKARIAALKAADPASAVPIPVDLVTASASGLDPDISIAAAYYQVGRIARERHMSAERVRALVDGLGKRRVFGTFGEPSVNVLALNLALDQQE